MLPTYAPIGQLVITHYFHRMTTSPRTKLHVYRVASEMFGDAVGWGVLQTNPWALVRAPRPERTHLRIPTVKETKTILEALRDSIAEGPAMLAVGCGLRLGEAIALRWADVDLERRRIRVTATMYQDGRTEPKSARSRRTVAMPIFVPQYLRTHKVAQNERRLGSVAWAEADYVFDRGGGVPMLLLSVSHRFSKCADAIGLGDVRFHDLRHAYATRLLERGVHPKVISEALGHSSISITMDTYSHVMPSMSQVAADAIDAVLGE